MNNDEIEQTHRDDLARAVKKMPKRPQLSTYEQVKAVYDTKQAARVNGVLVDGMTAAAIVKVHDALNEKNRATFVALPIRKMGITAWKLVSGKGR